MSVFNVEYNLVTSISCSLTAIPLVFTAIPPEFEEGLMPSLIALRTLSVNLSAWASFFFIDLRGACTSVALAGAGSGGDLLRVATETTPEGDVGVGGPR